jgi:hypothetical protein
MSMESDMAGGLAAVAAGRLIELLATDGWAAMKASVLSLWRHSHPEHTEADLDEARGELIQATRTGDGADVRELLVDEWQARLARLIATRPEVTEELRALFPDTSQATNSITQEAHVSGGGDAFQAGRDMKITKGGTP